MKVIKVSFPAIRIERRFAEVARRCGVSHSHISAVLHGRREASPSLCRRLARLGINVAAYAPAK